MATRSSCALLSRRTLATSARARSFARLQVCGNLVESPKKQLTKNSKPYWLIKIATSDRSGPPNADGTFPDRTSSYHSIVSFLGADKEYMGTLPKGTLVHAEAAYSRKSEKKSDDSYSEITYLNLEKFDVLKKPQVEASESQ